MSNTITQVTEKNDWEHLTYFAGKSRLDPETTLAVVVSWPNGVREVCPVTWKRETHSYTDHGLAGSARSWVPYIKAMVNGLIITIKLSRLEIVL